MGSKHPIVSVGFTTSVDVVQNQTYSTKCSAGVKRPLSCLESELVSPTDYQNPGQKLINSSNGFKRPQIRPSSETARRLKASIITDLTTTVEDLTSVSAYTQRKILASTPGISQNALLSLSHQVYGLPHALVRNFSALGINSIYPWQSSCLLGRGLLTGEKNLVYTAPTGGGKSLVADILMLKRVIENKKAILVLPYVALVQEKLKWLRRAVKGIEKRKQITTQSPANPPPTWRKNQDHSSVRVVGYYGGSKARTIWNDIDIAVCTIEKVRRVLFLETYLMSSRQTH